MFKKKPQIKPLAPLKSSDRRRLADSIIQDFALELPIVAVDATADAAAADADATPDSAPGSTAALTTLRKNMLPENALSARFTTTAGPGHKLVTGTVYVGSHRVGGEQRILWAKLNDVIFPTVYTLWHNPGMVPLLHTPAVVIEKLQSGADLMTPGLQRGPPFPQNAKKGALVAIASLERPSVPVAVGTCEFDLNTLDKVQGAKGRAVSILHWAGDELWSWASAGRPGGQVPDSIEGWDDSRDDDGDTTLAERVAAVGLSDDEGGVVIDADSTHVQMSDVSMNSGGTEIDDEKELSTKEIDDAFQNAFLFGVRHHMDLNKELPNHGLDFPLSQSHVMAQLVCPFLPTYTPKRVASLQMKKSSWKNVKRFIKHLDKQSIVKCKDRDGNEVVILDIDFKDSQIKAFDPYPLPKKLVSAPATANKKPATPSDITDPSIGQQLRIQSLLRPKEKLAPILQASKADPRGFYSPAELRKYLVAYIEAEGLVDQKNRRLVRINPQLADALLGSSAADNAALAAGTMARDVLAERMTAVSSPFHAILRKDGNVADTKPKSGTAPKIQILMETRSGNKTVTKVHGLEPYYITPQPLADELRKTCAGSTAIDQLQGTSQKAPIMEIMVQGPQKDAVMKALEKRGVNRNWIEIVDKTKGKKK